MLIDNVYYNTFNFMYKKIFITFKFAKSKLGKEKIMV